MINKTNYRIRAYPMNKVINSMFGIFRIQFYFLKQYQQFFKSTTKKKLLSNLSVQ